MIPHVLLGLMLICQAGGDPSPPEGVVLDLGGHAADGIEVYLTADAARQPDGSVATVARATTDVAGRFRFEVPPPILSQPSSMYTLWAYKPGRNVATAYYWRSWRQGPITIRLEAEFGREVRVADSKGNPVAGVKVQPRSASAPNTRGFKMVSFPDELAERLSAVSDAEGKAIVKGHDLANSPLILVSTATLARQRVTLDRGDGLGALKAVVEVAGSLAGRVARSDGRSSEGLQVVIESQSFPSQFSEVVLPVGGPIRVGKDGSFWVSDGLLAGVRYQVTVRGEGVMPAESAWITAPGAGTTATLPDLVLTPTREVSGRIVDRQGKPIAGASVIQSGDGPERTMAKADAEGRFRLGGYGSGPGLIAATAAGFRYGGRLASDGENAIVLTRLSERPERSMPSVPPTGSPEELRALARRLLDPVLAAAKGDKQAIVRPLLSLARVDPFAARDLAIENGLHREGTITRLFAATLGRADLNSGIAFTEGITGAGERTQALLAMVDALPNGPDPRKEGLLARATSVIGPSGQDDWKVLMLGGIAERYAELGQVERARPLLADGMVLAAKLGNGDWRRAEFATRLGWADPIAALAMIRDIPDEKLRKTSLSNLATRVAASRPDLYEQIVAAFKEGDRDAPALVACNRMAATDPAHARRIADAGDVPRLRGLCLLALAHGLPRAAREEAETAFHDAMTQLTLEQHSPTLLSFLDLSLAPVVEEIDPALVPEYLWLSVAWRPPTSLIRSPQARSGFEGRFLAILARYDRETAGAMMAPRIAEAWRSTPDERNAMHADFFIAMVQVEPLAGAEMIESLPRNTKSAVSWSDSYRSAVAEFLGRWVNGLKPPALTATHGIYETLHERDGR